MLLAHPSQVVATKLKTFSRAFRCKLKKTKVLMPFLENKIFNSPFALANAAGWWRRRGRYVSGQSQTPNFPMILKPLKTSIFYLQLFQQDSRTKLQPQTNPVCKAKSFDRCVLLQAFCFVAFAATQFITYLIGYSSLASDWTITQR